MFKSSFNDGRSVHSGDAPATYVRDVEDEFEMDPMGKRAVAEKYRGTGEDQRNMRTMGRIQELRRNFGFLAISAFNSTLICTWEVVFAASGGFFINGGTAGLFWGFVFVATGLFLNYISLAEMASMAPTSGGQYHWVSEFAPRSYQKYLSYLTGWLCFIAWQAGLTSITFLAGTIIQGLIALNDPSYVYKNWHGTLLVIGIAAFCVFFNTFLAKKLPVIESILFVLHILGLFAIVIPLWILAPRNNAKAAFTQFTNTGGWPTDGVSFMVGLNSALVCLLGFDSAIHMSEEVEDASRTLPRSIVWSMVLNVAFGLVAAITIIFTLGDMAELLKSPTGYPFIQIFYNTTASFSGTNAMTAIILISLSACSIAATATASRQIWSFARDNGTPFSATIARVPPGWEIPLNAVLISLVVTTLLSLINIGSSAALNAIFSINIGANLTSYMVSIGCLLAKRFRGEALPARRWSLGRYGMAINIASLMFLTVMFVFCFFPAATPVVPTTMNWGCLMYGFLIVFATGYYFAVGRKVYISPTERVRREMEE